jgi:hypothetical protein
MGSVYRCSKPYNKYLLFRAIPMNLLLWGCETWSLQQSLLDKLEVFLHKSIRRILKISMFRVINEKLRNEQVRTTFYAMPCVKNMIAARQLDYIGKLIRGPHDQPARRMITSIHTLKLRGQTRLSWREVRGQRIRVRVKHKTGASREKKMFHLGRNFLGTAYN